MFIYLIINQNCCESWAQQPSCVQKTFCHSRLPQPLALTIIYTYPWVLKGGMCYRHSIYNWAFHRCFNWLLTEIVKFNISILHCASGFNKMSLLKMTIWSQGWSSMEECLLGVPVFSDLTSNIKNIKKFILHKMDISVHYSQPLHRSKNSKFNF